MRLIAALVALLATADAEAACTLGTIVPPSFTGYNVYASSPHDTTGSITYTCTLGLFVTIDLSKGTGTYASRTLTRMGGGGTLSYNLYTDAGRSTVWGDGNSGTGHYGPLLIDALNAGKTLTVFARAAAQQDARTGSYDDTIVVTISY